MRKDSPDSLGICCILYCSPVLSCLPGALGFLQQQQRQKDTCTFDRQFLHKHKYFLSPIGFWIYYPQIYLNALFILFIYYSIPKALGA